MTESVSGATEPAELVEFGDELVELSLSDYLLRRAKGSNTAFGNQKGGLP